MDREQWQRIDELFEAALDREAEDRPSFLAEACGGEPTVRLAVEALLRHDEQADEFMEVPAAAIAGAVEGLVPDPTDSGSGAIIGESIGPYRVEREIARGGMASVYLGVRADEEYERRVALKLLQPGMTSDYLLKRFLSERQILANLEHPNIAHLFEGGTTEDGRPYLVMEYIDGRTIDVYCDDHGLSVRQRVELFRKVCSAVHCAHQNLVVHRDIKPSNVLVGADGEPRLLDFGIAKLLDPEAFPMTLEVTATGLQPMTPNYASPEQVRGGSVTTATDVYSLGVLLYKLLTGRLPHRLTHLSPREIEHVLETEETPKPSTAVAVQTTGDPTPLAAPPQQLRRQLAGDLDNIVLMALRSEPGRRYGSVQQLSQDLHRYLTGRPVLAREDTVTYQMSKFLRRHRLAVAGAGLVLALIVAFAAAMAWQASETARQRDRAELERDKAEQVSEFLVDIFKEANPRWAATSDLTVREFLDRGAVKIEQELTSQTEVQATLRDAVGSVYAHLGDFEQAAALLEQSLAAREGHLGQDHLDVAESLFHVGGVYRRQGKYAEAEPLLERALAIREAALGGEHPDVARVLREMQNLRVARGRFAEAEALGRRALAIFKKALGPDHLEIVTTTNSQAGVFFNQGRTDAAERHLRSAVAMMERLSDQPTLMRAAMLTNLATLRIEGGDFEEASVFGKRALTVYENILVESHPFIGDTLLILAKALAGQDDPEAAELQARRALEVYRQALGDEHPSVANCLYELGHMILKEGRLADAEELFERSIAIREKTLETDHPLIAESIRGLAEVRAGQGETTQAERLYQRALAIWEQYPQHRSTSAVPGSYAAFLRAVGRDAAAAEIEARITTHQ